MRKILKTDLVAPAVFVFFLPLYFLTSNQLFSFDAITNAIACEANEPVRWFHSNHPLYPFVGMLWYKFEHLVGYGGYSIYSLARFNSLLMAAALALFSGTMAPRVGVTRTVLLTLCLGFSYAVWGYAVDGRAIGASVFFSMLVIAWMLRMDRDQRNSPGSFAVLALLSALTVLMHAIAVFHCLPLAVWAWRKNLRGSAIYVGVSAALVIAMYVGCYAYVASHGFATSFISWAVGYAGFNGSEHVAQSQYWGKSVLGIFSGLWLGWRNALFTSAAGGVQSVVAGVLSVLVLISMIACWCTRRRSPLNRITTPLFVWGALIMVFLAFWSPGQEGFRLHVLLPWTVASALCMSDARWVKGALLGLSAVLFGVNFSTGLYPASFIQNNRGYQSLLTIERQIKPGDVVITGPDTVIPDIEVIRPYFFPEIKGGSVAGRLFAFRETGLDPLRLRLMELASQGHALYFSDDLFGAEPQQRLESSANLNAGSVAAFVNQFEVVGELALPNGRKLLRLRPKTR